MSKGGSYTGHRVHTMMPATAEARRPCTLQSSSPSEWCH